MFIFYLLILSLVTTSNALFSNEEFKVGNVSRVFASSFNVTLVYTDIIYSSLYLKQMCQVPQFQMSKFNNDTNNIFSNKKKLLLKANRSLKATEVECDTVSICKNGPFVGSSSLCLGSNYHAVTEDCLKNYLNTVEKMTLEANKEVLDSAKDFSTITITNALQGLNTSLQTIVKGVNQALLESIDEVSAKSLQAILDSAAAVTNTMNKNLASLNEAVSARFFNTNNMISNATKFQETTTISLARRIQSLSDYVDNLVLSINKNSFDEMSFMENVVSSLLQVSASVEKLQRFSNQGNDISSLLFSWNNDITNNTVQLDTGNVYKYVSGSIIGIYDKTVLDLRYPIEKEVSGLTVYKCYELGTIPPPFTNMTTGTSTSNFYNTGRYINFIDKADSILNNVTPKKVIYNYIGTDYIYNVIYGNNTFAAEHPRLGLMILHTCSKLGTPSIVTPVYDYGDSIPFVTVDGYGSIVEGGYSSRLPGKITIKVAGVGSNNLFLSHMNIIVPQLSVDGKPIENQQPSNYYYVEDIWCCDDNNNPILTVNKTGDCSILKYSLCSRALYGYCKSSTSTAVDLRILGSSSNCPSGYNTTPTSTLFKYKGPTIRFCDTEGRSYREGTGISLAPCNKGEVNLPGVGTVIETGISMNGMYPADCIFANTHGDEVEMYTIRTDFNNKVVPILLNNLEGKKVAFSYKNGYVIDTMDNFNGESNSGIDCLRKSTDLTMHNPRNCLSYEMPKYDMTGYFSGLYNIPNSISANSAYFDITPYPGENGNLILNYKLKSTVDYQVAFVQNNNICPQLNIKVLNGICRVSGWSTQTDNSQIYVANQAVSTSSTFLPSIDVKDDGNITVIVKKDGKDTICNNVICYASKQTFIAYPIQDFQMTISRPNMNSMIPGQSTDSYNSILGEALNKLQNSFNEYLANVKNTTDLNGNIRIEFDAIDLGNVLDDFKKNFSNIINNINIKTDEMSTQLSNDINLLLEKSLKDINDSYITHSKNLEDNMSQYKQETEDEKKQSNTIAIVSIVIACVSFIVVTILTTVLIKKNKLIKKIKSRLNKEDKKGIDMNNLS